jgi:ribosome-associated heat shock protein Hsp15
VRLFKTRALAAGAVKGGPVRVDGVAVKPSREVGPVTSSRRYRHCAADSDRARRAERRVSAAEAANLYEETEKSVAEREHQVELRRLAGPFDFRERPTKRDRRRYDADRH